MVCSVAMVPPLVLSVVLKTHSPEAIMRYDDVGQLLEGLIPYTERHFQRLSRLQQVCGGGGVIYSKVSYRLVSSHMPTSQ